MQKVKNLSKIIIAKVCFFLCSSIFPKREKVLFESFDGVQYSDNPKAISDKLHEMFPDIEIVWHLRNQTKYAGIVPEYVKIVSGRLAFYRELASSSCFVKNTQFTLEHPKRKGQFYVQTWHGDRGFKKILFESKKKYPLGILDSKVTDLCIAGSDKGEKKYNLAFHYYGKILKVGSPRNDILVRDDSVEKRNIIHSLELNNKKILLYAPTFRDSSIGSQKLMINIRNVLNILNTQGGEWVCLVRSHVASKIQFTSEEDIIDVSSYHDMADLLLIADILITDYSSCSTDFLLTQRPTIMAMFDENEYQTTCRGLKNTPDEVGFIVARNQNELETILYNLKSIDFAESYKRIKQFYRYNETGKACEEVCFELKKACQRNNSGKRAK